MNRILLIDHFDSFSQLLAAQIRAQAVEVTVVRSSLPLQRILSLADHHQGVVLSPGPGRPETVPQSVQLCRIFEAKRPVLGICLGLQCLAAAAGATVVTAPSPRHGKVERLEHDGRGPFKDLPSSLRVGRYHSLGVTDVPRDYQVHARADGLVMAMSSPSRRTVGWQFHPESILTPEGSEMLRRALLYLEAES